VNKHKWNLVNILMVIIALIAIPLTACQQAPQPTEAPPAEAPTEAPAAAEPTEAPAEEENEWTRIQAAGKIVVGTSADYPPFEFINEDNEFDGFDMALIDEVGDRLGVEVELQDIAFDGLIAALKAGQIDAIIAAMSATPERDEEVDFTINYYEGTDAILVSEDSDLTFATADEMAGLKIGVQTGTVHEQWVQENLVDAGETDEADFVRYERADQAILDLKSGRIDVVAMDYFAALAYVEQGGIKLALEQNLSGENLAIAVAEGAAGLQWQLNQVIEELRDAGFIDQLAEQYLAGEIE